MNEGIEVRVRGADEVDGKFLCRVSHAALDSVIAELTRWGIYWDGDMHRETAGQFVLDDSGAYFEVIIGVE